MHKKNRLSFKKKVCVFFGMISYHKQSDNVSFRMNYLLLLAFCFFAGKSICSSSSIAVRFKRIRPESSNFSGSMDSVLRRLLIFPPKIHFYLIKN